MSEGEGTDEEGRNADQILHDQLSAIGKKGGRARRGGSVASKKVRCSVLIRFVEAIFKTLNCFARQEEEGEEDENANKHPVKRGNGDTAEVRPLLFRSC